jgi:hypothetical protein
MAVCQYLITLLTEFVVNVINTPQIAINAFIGLRIAKTSFPHLQYKEMQSEAKIAHHQTPLIMSGSEDPSGYKKCCIYIYQIFGKLLALPILDWGWNNANRF